MAVPSDIDDLDELGEVDDDFLRSIPLDFPEPTPTPAVIDLTSDPPSDTPDCESVVNPPSTFAFPFEPYDIQVGFMQSLYKALELGKVGIFESPTGTGKSLSLICGALTWLKEYEDKQRKELEALLAEDAPREEPLKREEKKEVKDEPDWITAYAQKQEKDEKSKKLKEERELRLKRETRLQQLRNNLRPTQTFKRKRDKLEEEFDELFKDIPKDIRETLNAAKEDADHPEGCEDDEILLGEYQSDDEKATEEKKEEDTTDDHHITKIYYCSRTHSQLAQFVREVQKTSHAEDTRVISLGSRQNLCINDAVKSLKSLSLMNDRCLELQKNKNKSNKKKKDAEPNPKKRKTPTAGGCPFYKQDPVYDYRDRALVEVKDIEQLVGLGRQMKACPYYGTRIAIPASQLVALPYNTLLHKSTRDSCGIKLKGNIVIIDEAHNLSETISNIHSVEVSGSQLTCAFSQLNQYTERYRSRLKAKNLMYVRHILFVLTSFIKVLGGKNNVHAEQQKFSKSESKLQTINDFLFVSKLDNLNLFKVKKYCERSMISKKLHGFVEKYQPPVVQRVEKKDDQPPTWALSKFLKEISQNKDDQTKTLDPEKQEDVTTDTFTSLNSPLMHIESFLEALTTANKDGRIVVHKKESLSKSSLKFLLLNPAVHFGDIVSEARAVIVAGGTMQPIADFKEQLFFSVGVKEERILEYSCGHVIDAGQLLPLALARGSSGHELDFTYQSRDLPAMMDELGRVVYNVCNVVPGGVVVFFPSYEYEKVVYAHWEKAGFLQKILSKKKIYREPRQSTQVNAILSEYTAHIKKHLSNKYSTSNGAVLFSVVGGKMSEGINFSDELGRCIIMVGLPYPNIRSPELKEKMDYLNANMPRAPDGKLPGQVHYENLCMKAVNQSIGRAIRHKNDYACILLLDHRYLRPSMKNKLPGWIGEQLQPVDRFGPAFSAIRKFFADRKPVDVS